MNIPNSQLDRNEMCWLHNESNELLLHLKQAGSNRFVDYRRSPHGFPDYPINKGSKGYATFQILYKAGWVLIPTPQPVQEDMKSV